MNDAVKVGTGFHVHGDDVCADIGEIVYIVRRIFNHQVHVERDGRDGFNGADYRRAEGDVGDEMAIHNVQMQQVRSCLFDALKRNEETGAIDIDYGKCVKCQACVAACPFGCALVDNEHDEIVKCDLCQGNPACAAFCPEAALRYVPVEEGTAPWAGRRQTVGKLPPVLPPKK